MSERDALPSSIAIEPEEPARAIRILVVDDDEVDRMVVRRRLASAGIEAELDEAESAQEALRLLVRGSYDCVLLDFNIPGGDGRALLRALRQAGLEVPVIMLTGLGDEQIAVDLMKAGAADYIAKNTLTPERLSQSLRHAMSLGRAQTEMRRAQGELRATAERLSLAAESAAIGTWDFNPVTGELRWDTRCKAIFGMPPNAKIDHDIFLSRLRLDERERADEGVRHALDPRGDGKFSMTLAAQWNDGTVRWVDSRGRAFFSGEGDERHATRFIGTALDVTENKRAEDALREDARIVETVQRIGSALAAELNINNIVQTVTDEATKLTTAEVGAFFYNTTDERGEVLTLFSIAGVPRESFAKFPMPRNTQIFAPTFHATGIVRSGDITRDPRYGHNAPFHGMPAGHLPVVSYLAVPVVSHTGEPLGGLFFGHTKPDVFTERHERLAIGIAGWTAVAMDNASLYASEQRARADAERASRAKSEFLAAMSHDLRTPLNAIGGYAQLMELGVHGPVSDAQRDALGRIRRSQEHLLTLITDILNFAKLESGSLQMRCEPIGVRELLGRLDTLIAPQVRTKELRYTIDAASPDVAVRADPDRALQVLLNLLSNAVKFTQTGGSIDISWEPRAETVLISIRDTGRGISAEKLPTIFEPFVQL
ncbi:MAG: response regulator, partial [Gemmatimonadota bacterium]|nr:response regulator [Gemmatimonadota bacterium]